MSSLSLSRSLSFTCIGSCRILRGVALLDLTNVTSTLGVFGIPQLSPGTTGFILSRSERHPTPTPSLHGAPASFRPHEGAAAAAFVSCSFAPWRTRLRRCALISRERPSHAACLLAPSSNNTGQNAVEFAAVDRGYWKFYRAPLADRCLTRLETNEFVAGGKHWRVTNICHAHVGEDVRACVRMARNLFRALAYTNGGKRCRAFN